MSSNKKLSLEKDKTTEFKWIKKGQESIMLENRQPDDDKHYKIMKRAFETLKTLQIKIKLGSIF